MANVSIGSPYALNAIVVSEVFYDLQLGYWFSLTLVLATQLTGFGLAGLCRRFLVWPSSMIWPQNLVACALLNTLHADEVDDGIGLFGGKAERGRSGMSRYRFFVVMTVASFVWYFLPGENYIRSGIIFCLCYDRVPIRILISFFVYLLGCPEQRSPQPTFWSSNWSWYELSYFRLDTDKLDWKPFDGLVNLIPRILNFIFIFVCFQFPGGPNSTFLRASFFSSGS